MLASLDRARVLVADDHRMFLELKFHDTPNTVTQAAESAVQTGACSQTACAWRRGDDYGRPRARREAAEAVGRLTPLLIGVTVLTSMTADGLRAVSMEPPLNAPAGAHGVGRRTRRCLGVTA